MIDFAGVWQAALAHHAVTTPTVPLTTTTTSSGGSGHSTPTWTPWATLGAAAIAFVASGASVGVSIWNRLRQDASDNRTQEINRQAVDQAGRSANASQASADAAHRSAGAAEAAVRVNAESAEAAGRRTDAAALSTRYQDAATQLGSDKAAIRLAGVYAMARLADDWKEERQTCIDVLCSYLRMPTQLSDEIAHRHEREVRKTVLSVLSHHLIGFSPAADWRDLYFNLEEAHLFDINLCGAQFSTRPNFKGATFEGVCRFDGAEFLDGADFSYSTVDTGAVLSLEHITVRRELLLRNFTILERASVLIKPRDLADGKIEAQALHVRGRLFIEVIGSQEVAGFFNLFESQIGPSGTLEIIKDPMETTDVSQAHYPQLIVKLAPEPGANLAFSRFHAV